MAIDYEELRSLAIPPVEQRYDERDVILYALGLGFGQNPLDEDELAFVYEKDLKVLPTFPAVLGRPDFWIRDLPTGIDFATILHGEERVVLHRPLAARGDVIGTTKVREVVDKGPGKGALVFTEREIVDRSSGERLATVNETTFCRSEGGFGGLPRSVPKAHAMPEREPDLTCDLPTRPEAAAIYRLSGDRNPLHIEPAAARAAGYERPILHGLATFGVCGHALLRTLCGYDPSRLTEIGGRFTAPVIPGDTIRTEVWRDGATVSFRARALERELVVMDNGRAAIVPALSAGR